MTPSLEHTKTWDKRAELLKADYSLHDGIETRDGYKLSLE